MISITLVCWCCGAERDTDVDAPPSWAFELAGIASDAGWIGLIDHGRGRVVVLCGDACRDACITKRGFLRARPPKRQAA